MNLTTEIFGDVIVVHAPDEVGREQADAFAQYLPTLDRKNVVLDLDATEAIDSAGLEAIVKSQRELIEDGGDIKISVTNATNRKILEITRLDVELEIFDSVIDAVKSFA